MEFIGYICKDDSQLVFSKKLSLFIIVLVITM